MALALGLEGVRPGVASQVTLHPRAGPLNKLRAGIYASRILQALGVDTLDHRPRRRPLAGPSGSTSGPCGVPVRRGALRLPFCRRMMFMYGEVYDHDQLNDATHEALHEVFGVANMATFEQITLALREGHIVPPTARTSTCRRPTTCGSRSPSCTASTTGCSCPRAAS